MAKGEQMADGKPTPIIRRIKASDRSEWTRLWHGYLTFYKTSLPDDIYDETFHRLTSDHPKMHGLVAEGPDGLIGLVHYLVHDHFWRPQGCVYLGDLYADPAVRGTGVGRLLIEAVYSAADTLGTPYVYWLTQDDNTEARKLYDRVGSLTNFIKYQRPS